MSLEAGGASSLGGEGAGAASAGAGAGAASAGGGAEAASAGGEAARPSSLGADTGAYPGLAEIEIARTSTIVGN